MKTSKALASTALAGLLAAGLTSMRPPRPAPPRNATASRRRARTIAAPPPTRARARPPRTTTPSSGRRSPRALARRWAASSPPPPGRQEGAPGKAVRRAGRLMPPARAPDASHAGIGLRAPHYAELARRQPAPRVPRGPQRELLRRRRPAARLARALPRRLSIEPARRGPVAGLGRSPRCTHLREAARARARASSRALVSEHLCWGVDRRAPRQRPAAAALYRGGARACRRAHRRGAGPARPAHPRRERLVLPRVRGCRRCPSGSSWPKPRAASGCGILLDVNNIHVNAVNHGFDARAYLDAIAPAARGRDPPRGLRASRRRADRHARRARLARRCGRSTRPRSSASGRAPRWSSGTPTSPRSTCCWARRPPPPRSSSARARAPAAAR